MSVSNQIPISKDKINYIDHLKVILTILVVLHHAVVTYGGTGSWYFIQRTELKNVLIPMTLFLSVNQSFFMGFFFFLSALFIPSSYEKKGALLFVRDRLFRLGIPLLFYSFILSPPMNYLVYYFGGEHHITFFQYLSGYDSWINFGVLWFVAALLLFTLIFVVYRISFDQQKLHFMAPSLKKILLFAAGLGIVSFLVRSIFPVGWTLNPVGFQLGHFPQYIALFILGLIAAENNWLKTLSYRQGKQGAIIAIAIIVFGFPIIYAVKTIFDTPLEWFKGGLHWPGLLYAVWEQLTGFSVIIALLGIGKQLWDKPSPFFKKLSRYSFAVYIFHPLVLISLALALRSLEFEPALKLLIVAPMAVIFSFLLAAIVVKIPIAKRII